jgi:virulence factor Mce-like protein
METRTPRWRALVIPAGFALACVVLTIATWVAFGGSSPFQVQGYRFYMPLPAATNVYQDTSVRMAGITIGKVVTVSRAGANARALIEVAPRYAPLHSGARGVVRSKTLLGEGYIELAPGPESAPPIPDGGSLSPSNVMPTQQLFDVLRIFTPRTRAQIRSTFGGLAEALRGRSDSLSDSISYAGPTFTNIGQVAQTLAAETSSLQSLISDTGTVLSTLGTREGVIESAVREGDAALSATAQSESGLRATIAALPAFLRQLRSTATTATAASPDIAAGVGALNQASPELVPALEAIDTATPVFRTLFERLPVVLSDGERDLPALDRVLAAARPALPPVYTAMRELIPILQLLSADRDSVYGSLANAGAIQNGVVTAPGLGAIHYAAGALTVWNETAGGWVKKLPTNRSNPYPKPDEEADIASGGLRAFDCRNTGNPLWLPPTGTGAPHCLLQGPWKFDGKSAYYPRLQEAGP